MGSLEKDSPRSPGRPRPGLREAQWAGVSQPGKVLTEAGADTLASLAGRKKASAPTRTFLRRASARDQRKLACYLGTLGP
jgi:hypothetical protein